MANSINQRLTLTGQDEVRRGLASIAAQGQQSGNSIRAALLSAIGPGNTFNQTVQSTEVSAKATRYAIQNLSFQINDVVTSIGSGISPFRTFTQQGGQFVQLFQQGGGVGAVVGGFATRLASIVTPTRLAVAGVAALGTGIAALAIRAENSEVSAQKFDVQLKGIGRSSGVAGKDLEAAAKRLGDVGLSASEARTKISEFLSAGGDARFAEKIVRGAEDLSAVLGKATGDSFSQAVGEGSVAALQNIAKRLNIPITEATKSIFVDFTEANRKLNFELVDMAIRRNRAIVDVERRTRQQIRDLTREPGTERSFPGQEDITQRKEILVQSARQEEEIVRQSQEAISDRFRHEVQARNEANRKALEEYNKDIIAKSNEIGEAQRLALAITQKVSGAQAAALGPVGTAIQHLKVDWNNFLDVLTHTGSIAAIVKSIGDMIGTFSALIELIRAASDKFRLFGEGSSIWMATPIYWVTYFIGLMEKARALLAPIIGTAIRGIATNTSGVPSTPENTAGNNNGVIASAELPSAAAGGLFRGPGTGTSDSILARVSDGEFLVNAAATRMNYPLLQAINSMGRPISTGRRGFAAGGLVSTAAAGADRSSFTLVIEGREYGGLSAPAKTAKDMVQFARTSSIMSAGKSPSWKGTG